MVLSTILAQTSMSEPTNIKIPRGSIELLNSIVSTVGWTNKCREIVAAGSVAEKLEPTIVDRPIFEGQLSRDNAQPIDMAVWNAFQKTLRTWQDYQCELAFTDFEFRTCITAIKHVVDEKKMPTGKYTALLLVAFHLSE